MNRREVIAGLGSAAAARPVVARAQQAAVPVIGYLGQWPEESRLPAFRQGLGEAGYVEGRNVAIEYRWAEGHNDRLPALAADLVRRGVTAITTLDGIPAAVAAKAATTTIPIVFYVGVNPVELGLVTSLNRPGGNLTGVTSLNVELGPKRLGVLRELLPMATAIAVLLNPINPNSETQSRDLETAARILGVQVKILHASTEHEIDVAFASLTQLRAGALLIGADVFFSQPAERVEQIVALALRYSVPTIAREREFALAGAMLGPPPAAVGRAAQLSSAAAPWYARLSGAADGAPQLAASGLSLLRSPTSGARLRLGSHPGRPAGPVPGVGGALALELPGLTASQHVEKITPRHHGAGAWSVLDGLERKRRRLRRHDHGSEHPRSTAAKGRYRNRKHPARSRRSRFGQNHDPCRPLRSPVRQGIDRRRIFALTFTKKAADEMRSRIATALDLPSAPDLSIATFHGFAFRHLRGNPQIAGLPDRFPLWDTAQQRHVFNSRRMWWNGDVDILDIRLRPMKAI